MINYGSLRTFSVFVPIKSLLVLSCAFPTLGSLLSSDDRAWIALVSITGLPVLSQFGFRTGWCDWKLLDRCPTSDRWECSEPNSLLHSCFKEIFGGGRGWHVYSFVYDFSSFHPNNFRNTVSWKCFLKDDCIRSSLIECQSLSNRKININPKYRVLMFLPCTMQLLCLDVVQWSQSLQDLDALCRWDQ